MKTVILNFSPHVLSESTLEHFGKPPVLQCPLSVAPDMDLTEYVDGTLDHIDIRVEEGVVYLLVLPGLAILAGMICRHLSEKGIPYQIINFIRKDGEFVIHGVY